MQVGARRSDTLASVLAGREGVGIGDGGGLAPEAFDVSVDALFAELVITDVERAARGSDRHTAIQSGRRPRRDVLGPIPKRVGSAGARVLQDERTPSRVGTAGDHMRVKVRAAIREGKGPKIGTAARNRELKALGGSAGGAESDDRGVTAWVVATASDLRPPTHVERSRERRQRPARQRIEGESYRAHGNPTA